MTVAIYQTSLSGHHGAYASAISAALVERRWKAKIIIPETSRQHPALSTIIATVGESNIVYSPFAIGGFASSRLSLLRHHFQQHSAAHKALRLVRNDCDFIYVPTLDQMDQAIRLLGSPSPETPVAGMSMRIKFHLSSQSRAGIRNAMNNRVGEASLRILLSPRGLRCLTTADPLLADYARSSQALSGKIRYVPEVGMDRSQISRDDARKLFGIRTDDKIILVYGAITERKGLPNLLAALAATNSLNTIKVLVVGELHEEVEKYLQSDAPQSYIRSQSLIIRAGFADDRLQAAAFSAADAVWAAYVGHQTMSGVFYQAICSGIPVIASNEGVMSLLARRHGVGPVVDNADPVGTGTLLCQLLHDKSVWSGFARRAAALSETHRPIQFGRAVCDAIASVG